MVKERVERVRERIATACGRCGRDPAEVTLVAVSKGYSADEIRQALEAGITHIGESRVQEAREKFALLSTRHSSLTTMRWHFIGHLQTNKVRQAVEMFDLIQSVDSFKLAATIAREAGRIGKTQDILIEVKTSPEVSKYGIRPEETGGFLGTLAGLKNIRVQGLMTIAPYSSDPERARPYFRQLRELRNELDSSRGTRHWPLDLSMGMTDDFEVAIEEGATLVRIGRAIFSS